MGVRVAIGRPVGVPAGLVRGGEAVAGESVGTIVGEGFGVMVGTTVGDGDGVGVSCNSASSMGGGAGLHPIKPRIAQPVSARLAAHRRL